VPLITPCRDQIKLELMSSLSRWLHSGGKRARQRSTFEELFLNVKVRVEMFFSFYISSLKMVIQDKWRY